MINKERINAVTTEENGRNRRRRFAKIALARLGIFIVALLAAGALYQLAATKIDGNKYRAPGMMIEVGGHRLHLNCTGKGRQTVLLEAGLGGGVLDWSLVQPEIAGFARVCSYDRAGTGWSEANGSTRDGRQIVEELHRLLGSAGIPPPYVMVGHSIGGVYAQLFASRYPDEVSAMVLVDSSHENQFARSELPAPSAAYPLLMKALAPLGAGRLIYKLKGPSDNLAPALADELGALYSHTGHLFTAADELAAIPESLRELRETPARLGDKPLIVLTRGRPQGDARAEQAWRELQVELATRSTAGRQIIAENSGHYIQLDEPGLVVDAVRSALR